MSEIYDLRMALDRIRPEIWRRLEVPADLSLAGLSRAIQRAFGWNGGHLWRFERRGREWGVPNEHDLTDPPADARTTSVGDALGDGVGRLDYVYDFGDHWEVTVEVEDRFAPESSVDSPRLLDGERAGPPDDCGGPPGYQQLVEGLETGDLPDFHQRWEDWDPEAFDADERELPSVETLEERARVDAARLGALSVEEVSERATSSGASIDDPADVSSGELAEAIIDPKADVDLGGLVETLEEIEATEVDDLGDLAEISFEVDDLGEELEEAREEVAATAQSQSGDRIVPPPGEKLRTFPTSMAVRDCLSRLSVGQLDRIFDNLGFDERPSRREQRANLIA
ncbi:MAG: plasmid pRiA4b ORF-3 family protein, partial [Bradymonadaceae bacterium]